MYTHTYLSLPVNHSTPLSFRVEHSSDCTIYNDPVTPYSHNTMETRRSVSVLLLSDVLEWTQIVEITIMQHNIYSTYDHTLVVHILTRKTCNDFRMVKFFSRQYFDKFDNFTLHISRTCHHT